jgi:hypothetical protein
VYQVTVRHGDCSKFVLEFLRMIYNLLLPLPRRFGFSPDIDFLELSIWCGIVKASKIVVCITFTKAYDSS